MALELCKITKDDLELIMNWRMRPEVTKYMYSDPKLTIESQLEWYEYIKDNSEVIYWIIKYDNMKIGVINLNKIDWKNKRCSWAYYIGETSFRGKGIGMALECNLYDYVFYNLNLNKLCCEVFTFNKKVIALHERFGSEIEGALKQHIMKNGEFFDIVIMGITKNKWDRVSNNYHYEKIIIED